MFMSDISFYVNLVLIAGLLPTHLALGATRSRYSRIAILTMMLLWLIYCVYLTLQRDVPLRDVVIALAGYSSALFIGLSEILVSGGAVWLTRKRGEHWTREIDYFYLGLGALGLLASLGQLQNVSDKVAPPSMFAPLAVATAIVLRAIKTRAEIGAWNKPSV